MRITVFILTLLFTGTQPAQAANGYVRGRLKNGLQYHILPTAAKDGRLAVQLQVGVGSDDEGAGEEGMAHMVEHMVFRSSPEYPDGISNRLGRQGWQMGGHFNARTTHEWTRFILQPPQGSRDLAEALRLTGEILRNRRFSPQDWKNEQKIVLAEWRGQQTAQNRLAFKLNAPLLAGSRQGRYPPIGGEAAIRGARAEALSGFHNKWYAPNNALLLITGDVDAEKVKKEIEARLGGLPQAVLPQRYAGEPALGKGWHSAVVRDADNTVNGLDVVFRFPNDASRRYDAEGEYNRLLDNFASYVLNLRLKSAAMPPEVLSVSLRVGNLARHTGAAGFYAQTAPGGHKAALYALLDLRLRILAAPATEQEIAAYRRQFGKGLPVGGLPATVPEALRHAERPDFASRGWHGADDAGGMFRQQLYRINAAAVNRRIAEWLNADDRLVVARAPGGQTPDLPDNASLDRPPAAGVLAAKGSKPAGPEAADKRAVPLLPRNGADAPPFSPAAAGEVTGVRQDHANKVSYLQLGNGDQAVLLQNAAAGDRVYFRAVADGGYMQSGLIPWQAKLAAELVWSSAPAGFSEGLWQGWKRQRGIRLDYRSDAYGQAADGDVPFGALRDLLQLYRAYYLQPDLGGRWQGRLQAEAQALPVSRRSESGRQERAAMILRYGRPEYDEPSPRAVAGSSRADLLRQWRLLGGTRVSYYIVSSRPAEEIQPLVRQYLASIPRHAASPVLPVLAGGSRTVHSAIGRAAKSDVYAWSWQPFYHWTPEVSEQIPLLVNLANARLKRVLREREAGMYGMSFRSVPLPRLDRVENELRFNADPARADDLARKAVQVLAQMSGDISREEADNLRRLFVGQEAARRRDPAVWLDRLVQSHQKYGDARYLSRLPQLHHSITETRLRQTAALLWSAGNSRVLISDPQP
ncbi:MAG: pitrilysin family protein [Neisseria sp.]|nr:pitrilysin family protein [Neisseria sp.]